VTLREFTLIADGSPVGTKVFDENGVEVKGVCYIAVEQEPGQPPMVTLQITGRAKFASEVPQ
jgi:hypothetical protein